MSQYDEHKYKRSSGSAPRPQPQKPLEPPAKPLEVTAADDPLVQCAAEIYEDGVHRSEEKQARGSQAGFGKISVEGVVQAAELPTEQPAEQAEEKVVMEAREKTAIARNAPVPHEPQPKARCGDEAPIGADWKPNLCNPYWEEE